LANSKPYLPDIFRFFFPWCRSRRA
jgi:hypothetical protein